MFDSLVFRSSQDWILLTSTWEFIHWNFLQWKEVFLWNIFLYIVIYIHRFIHGFIHGIICRFIHVFIHGSILHNYTLAVMSTVMYCDPLSSCGGIFYKLGS